MGRPLAVFDIDGTLIRWQLYHALGDQLAKMGLIKADSFLSVKGARFNWKNRAREDAFKEYEVALIKVFDEALTSISTKDFNIAAEAVFDEYKEQVYTYTRELIATLKSKGYLLFALSGSPEIIVEKIARFYGFDDFAATTYESLKGYYTGKKDLSVSKKPQLLKDLLVTYNADLKDSVSVGDTESDIDLLSMTENPIAFNPTKKLYAHARSLGWPIVLERKNVVYKLEPADKKYILV